jgi:multicomponent Na+:H+ antiporter subunit F
MDAVVDVGTVVALVLLSIAAVLSVIRVASAASVADRVIGLDTLLVVVLVMVVVLAARSGDGVYLDAVLAMALVAFIGSTAVGRFIERRGIR